MDKFIKTLDQKFLVGKTQEKMKTMHGHSGVQAQCSLAGHPATFVYVVEIGLLAHGGQQVQDAGVDADFLIAVLLPGVALDHVEQLSNKKQDSVFRMVLVEDQIKTINNPKCEAEGRKKKNSRQKPRSLPLAATEKLKRQLWLNNREKSGKTLLTLLIGILIWGDKV